MSAMAIHVNLLRRSEIVSSSPIRIRVMLPVAAMLATAAMILWWIIIYGAILLNTSSIKTLEDDIAAKKASHQRIIDQMNDANELETELEQLDYYRAGRHEWGETFAHLAEVIPLKIQLTRISIPAPPPQMLERPKGSKLPPLWGPEANTEGVTLTIAGRTTKETPVISLMESLESDTFTNSLVICHDPKEPIQSPRVKSFRQDAASSANEYIGKQRLLSFEIEYTAKERRFAR